MGDLVSTERLTKLYGCVIGVNDLTLALPPGVHGLLGPNGAGKSTLLKLITGQLRPTEGEVRVFGERPWNNPGLFERIGFCPEQDAFHDFLTGLEFVTALARLSGLDSRVARQRSEAALARCGAADFMRRRISTYSKGMRQRTKVAQALVHEPAFIILDEPLTATDPVGRHEMMELIGELHREGRSILISSHVLHEVEAMTDEFLLIYGGRVLASGNIHEIRGLMDEHPHRISIRCDRPRELGHLLMRDLPVTGIEVAERTGSLSVLTSAPRDFYERLPEIALRSGVRIEELVSKDDNLEAVFAYLVGGD